MGKINNILYNMADKIVLNKRSSVRDKKPLASDLLPGEIAINMHAKSPVITHKTNDEKVQTYYPIVKVKKQYSTGKDDNDTYAFIQSNGDVLNNSEFEVVYDSQLTASGRGSVIAPATIGGFDQGIRVSSLSSWTVSDIIDALVFPETWPTFPTTPEVSQYGGEASTADTAAKAVEVGTTITVNKYYVQESVHGKFNASYENSMDTWPAAAYTYTTGPTITACTVGSTITGYDKTTESSGSNVTAYTQDTSVVLTKDGSDTIKWDWTATYSAPTNKPLTSYSIETTQTGKTATDNKAVWVSKTLSGSKTLTLYSCYKYYVGYVNTLYAASYWSATEAPAHIKALQSSGLCTANTMTVTYTFPKGAKQQVLAIPSGYTFTAVDAAGSNITGTYSGAAGYQHVGTITCAGSATKVYNVYIAPVNAGLAANSKATFTIKKG